MCYGACVFHGGACGLHTCCAAGCLCVFEPMRVVVRVPGCVCLSGCLCIFVLCYVLGLWLCEYLSDVACVWQHVGLWTGLA